jgi:plastocyanin
VATRLLIPACVLGVLAAACSTIPNGTVDPGSGARFVVQVADSVDNVGLGNAIALDKDGVPYLSYWGFQQKVTGIPVSRPVGAPFIPAVQVSSQAGNGIWTRGAAAQMQDSPTGVVVPYGPATIKGLKEAAADNTNGTDIAVGADGTLHVVWTAQDGVYYAKGSPSSSFTATQLFKYASSLSAAGPIGRPSVAVDADGTPWVAYIVNAAAQQVRVASPDAKGNWRTTVVDTLPQCGGCPQPGPAQIGIAPDGPIVAFADPKAKAVLVAHLGGATPKIERVASGVSGTGLSIAVGKKGTDLSYYTGDGAVQLASSVGAGWTTVKVATAPPTTDQSPQALPETTGVAVDDAGKVWVAWYDGKKDAVQLASGDGSTFAPILTPGTTGGRYPSLAATPDGAKVFLSWYVNKPQDLRLGILGSLPGLAIAYPSPTPSGGAVAPASSSPAQCNPDGTKLTITASGTAFDEKCLAAHAGSTVTLSFVNKDAVPHDFSIYPSASEADQAKAIFYSFPHPNPGSTTNEYSIDLSKQKPGSYYFRCDFHPTTMTGAFIVAK